MSPGVTKHPLASSTARRLGRRRGGSADRFHEPVGDRDPAAVELTPVVVDGGDEDRVAHEQVGHGSHSRDAAATARGRRLLTMDTMLTQFETHGYAIVRGCFTDTELDAMQAELERLQDSLLAGELPEQCGTVILDDPDAQVDSKPFAHYVCEVTRVAPRTRAAVMHPMILDAVTHLLGPECWLLEDDRFGVVYQDARPGAHSGYSRIGWHSDAQSGPNLDWWPSVAFTIHLDAYLARERLPARRARLSPRRYRRHAARIRADTG